MFLLLNIESICEERKGMVSMMIKNGILERLTYAFIHETDPEVLACILFFLILFISLTVLFECE